jgi:hypothetical protein
VKWWRIFVLVAVGIAVFVLIYAYRQQLGITGPSGESEENANSGQNAPAHIVWQKVDRTPDGFTVDMPTDTTAIQIPAYNQTGGADQVDMIYSYPDSETSYSVAWADHPPVARYNGESPEKTLDMARDDALARTQCTLIGESRSTRQGFPARDFAGRNDGGGIFNARLIMAGPRLYMLIAAFPAASARRDQDVQRFFDSFTLASSSKND